jgi:hypothetical protein
MRKLLPFVAVLIAFALSSRADEKVAAPVPKDPDVPLLDGSYTVNYTYAATAGGWGGPGFGPGGAGGPVRMNRIALRTSGATITKKEIIIGSNPDLGWGGFDDGSGFGVRGNLNQTMTYTIDPTQTPTAIDIFITDVRNKKTKSLGIIEVMDDRITIAVAKPGAERPKNTEETEEGTVYYFKKNPPPPRDEYRIVSMTVGKEAEAEKEMNKLAKEGYQLVNTTNPSANDPKSSHTTVHFVLKRTVR